MTAPLLVLESATLSAGRIPVLRLVDLVLQPGELLLVSGLNGSGKSSLLRLIAGVVRPSSGRSERSGSVAFVPGSVDPLPMSAKRWLNTFPRARKLSLERALRVLGFAGEIDGPSRNLSFGNRRKLLLAEALTSDTSLIVLDEASVGLDDVGRQGLRALCDHRRELGAAVVVSDHEDGWDWRESRAVWMADGTLTEPDHRRVVTQLVGPAKNLEAMLKGADAHDFSVH